MAGERLSRILAALSDGGEAWSSARLCGVCREIVDVNGAGVMLMSGDLPRGSLCTTGEVSELIEELQYTLGEGPCVDAYHQDAVVSENARRFERLVGELAAQKSCAVLIGFLADEIVSAAGTVTFVDNATGSPQQVQISGNVVKR